MSNFPTIRASSCFIGKLVVIIIYKTTIKVIKKTSMFPKFEIRKYYIVFHVKTMFWTLQLNV